MKNPGGGGGALRSRDVCRRPFRNARACPEWLVPRSLGGGGSRRVLQGRRGGLPSQGPAPSGAEGFTLIELMVVIAIIAILIAITLPVYRGAREHVRQRACMANLYQIANALQLYRVNEGAYPGPYDPVTGQGGLNALYPYYLDNRKALICPDDTIQDGQAYVEQYGALLAAADAVGMYTEPVWENRWYDKAFFSEHYSSYNALYNYMGYVVVEEDYSLCGYATHHMGVGDSLSYWYEWYRWDPEGKIYATDPNRFQTVDQFLHYHLAQQVYWYNYRRNPFDVENPSRLADNLARPLWDIGDAPRTHDPEDWSLEGWYPFGLYSSVFPGLINRNAPDNTIVTRCPYHRAWTTVSVKAEPAHEEAGQHGGIGGYGRGRIEYQPEETPRDIVLRLDGSTSLVRGFGYDWARQPR